MNRLRVALAAAVVAVLAVAVPSPVQAYPGSTCTVSDVTVVGGEDATVTASVDPPIDSEFELTYQGQVHTDSGVTSTTATFDTPEVDETTETTVFATVSEGGDTTPCTGTITLTPVGGDDDDDDGNGGGDDGDGGGILPNTGGERLAWLIIGILLVLVGGGVTMASRRRHT